MEEGKSSLDALYQITVWEVSMQNTNHNKQQDYTFADSLIPFLEKEGLLKESERLCSCGRKYVAFTCSENKDHPHTEFVFPYHCELRICPECAKRRGIQVRKETLEIIKPIQQTSTHKFLLLTLTLKKTDAQLSPERLRKFTKDVRKLINHFYPKMENCGAFSVMEIGPNLNIHAHVLLYGPYVSQTALSKKWFKITGDSYIVDVRIAQDQIKALSYITKYLIKPPSFKDLSQYVEVLKALKGVRRLSKYGIFYGVHIEIREKCKCPYCGASIKYVARVDSEHIEHFQLYWDILKKECA